MNEHQEMLSRLTVEQLAELLRLSKLHPDSTWHLNDCGCCVCFHPAGATSQGWIIGQDGESEFVAVEKHR